MDNGVLGLLCATLMAAVIHLYRELRAEIKAHKAEIKELNKAYKEEISALQIALSETSRDHYEQARISAEQTAEKYLSLHINDLETRSHLMQTLNEVSDNLPTKQGK